MGRDHHVVAGLEIEGRGGGQIDPRLRLVVAGVSDPRIASQENPLRRARSTISEMLPLEPARSETALEPGKTRLRVATGVEPMPGEIELAQHRIRRPRRGRSAAGCARG